MATAPFRVGSKELFLPNVNISFLRGRIPSEAKFRVPLWFSKLDLRDYLFHAYNVEILAVRSYVKQSRVQPGKPNEIRPSVRRWHRPKAQKYMTVSLARPFVWPEEPENYDEWNRKDVKLADEETGEWQERLMGSLKDAAVNKERRERMREQAKALLEGKVKWQGPEKTFNTILGKGQ